MKRLTLQPSKRKRSANILRWLLGMQHCNEETHLEGVQEITDNKQAENVNSDKERRSLSQAAIKRNMLGVSLPTVPDTTQNVAPVHADAISHREASPSASLTGHSNGHSLGTKEDSDSECESEATTYESAHSEDSEDSEDSEALVEITQNNSEEKQEILRRDPYEQYIKMYPWIVYHWLLH